MTSHKNSKIETNKIHDEEYDPETGLPIDKGYLECGLPTCLQDSINRMVKAWRKVENGEDYHYLDADFCELQSEINIAEVSDQINSEQAWYLREKYLRIEKPDMSFLK